MKSEIRIRPATVQDAEIIGYHRARMFHDMGQIPDHLFESFRSRSAERLRELLDSGEYLGWLAANAAKPDQIVAGAGVQLRQVLPHPGNDQAFAEGRHGLIINVFTEPEWRRRGLAKLLTNTIITWSREQNLDGLVLHASGDGRALYEQLGFISTTEMRLGGGDD